MAVLNGQLQGLLHSLEHLQRQGSLPCPPTSTTASGQTIVDVFPQGFWESKLSLLGAGDASVKLYCQPGKPVTQGHFYREPHAGKVAVVLGAGGWVGGWIAGRAGQGKAGQGRMYDYAHVHVCMRVLPTGASDWRTILTDPTAHIRYLLRWSPLLPPAAAFPQATSTTWLSQTCCIWLSRRAAWYC